MSERLKATSHGIPGSGGGGGRRPHRRGSPTRHRRRRLAGLSLVDQHRRVYDALAEPLGDGTIHELRITTRGGGMSDLATASRARSSRSLSSPSSRERTSRSTAATRTARCRRCGGRSRLRHGRRPSRPRIREELSARSDGPRSAGLRRGRARRRAPTSSKLALTGQLEATLDEKLGESWRRPGASAQSRCSGRRRPAGPAGRLTGEARVLEGYKSGLPQSRGSVAEAPLAAGRLSLTVPRSKTLHRRAALSGGGAWRAAGTGEASCRSCVPGALERAGDWAGAVSLLRGGRGARRPTQSCIGGSGVRTNTSAAWWRRAAYRAALERDPRPGGVRRSGGC